MQDVYWNLLRTRVRQVPVGQRRKWTDEDIAEWLVTFCRDPAVAAKEAAPPAVDHVKRVCADLIGESAHEF